jgi:hypothetical protein
MPPASIVATQTPTPAVEVSESPLKSFRARMGAKFKLIFELTLQWMMERLFFLLR